MIENLFYPKTPGDNYSLSEPKSSLRPRRGSSQQPVCASSGDTSGLSIFPNFKENQVSWSWSISEFQGKSGSSTVVFPRRKQVVIVTEYLVVIARRNCTS